MNRFIHPVKIKDQYIKYRLPFFQSEVYFIRWFPNAVTEKHNHNGKQCDFIPLKGCLYEKRYIKRSTREYQLKPFRKYSINDSIGEHQIINYDNSVKWSLHKYY